MTLNHVLVICSVHRDTGLANASELLGLLERVRPDVIFLELSSSGFEGFFDGSRACLEATASSLYRDRHPVELVPVDLAPPGVEFARSADYLFDRIEAANPQYCRLRYLHHQLIGTRGFAYLNSVESKTRWSAIEQEMRATVEELGERRLNEAYASWTRAQELREAAMMKGVEDYARERPFGTGVFLVGLAHGHSILDKSRSDLGDDSTRVQWDILATT